MPIRLRLAAAFALAAAALFALGGWLFAAGLSSAQLRTLDSQLTAQLAQAGRYLPAGGGGTAGRRVCLRPVTTSSRFSTRAARSGAAAATPG